MTRTFPEVLMEHARTTPSVELLRPVQFVKGEPIASAHSASQLWESAHQAALALAELKVNQGDRILIAVADPKTFLAYLVGAQCRGAIPVPAPSLTDSPLKAYLARIDAIVQDANPSVVVVDSARAAEAVADARRLGARVHRADVALPSTSPSTEPPDFRPACCPDDVAFLQYTSGSTGAPKGVVVLHRNLVANIEAIIEGGEMGERDVVFSWLPLFHDMGLVAGLLLGLYLGIPTYVASPKSFIARPEAWLRAISRFGATFSAGPNFAFNALANRVPDRALRGIDLSTWRLAFDGAELVDPDTIRAFVERYGAYGFRGSCLRPAYGLAEATLAVTFSRTGTPSRFDCIDRVRLATEGIASPAEPSNTDAVVYTSVGTPIPYHVVRILDPTSSEIMPERHVGEVVVVGPSVTPGYFAELAAGTPRQRRLRTGDLGYLADGELYIVDRLKDLLIIAGRKYSPSDLERRIGALDGVRGGAVIAFSVRGSEGTEELCILASFEPGQGSSRPALHESINRTLFECFGLTTRHVFVVRPGDIPRTSSGKLQRSVCRARFESGQMIDRNIVTGGDVAG